MNYELRCPYCNCVIDDPGEYFESAMAEEMVEIECDNCEKTFNGCFTIGYESEKLETEN